jgi:GNAT superfamily N-acetyltransferase
MEAPVSGTIRRAVPEEAAFLHVLTGRSALYWGYEPAFLEWEPDAIAVTAEFLETATAFVLEEQGRVVGYYALVNKPPDMYLDKLFVEPDRIGTGCGKQLWLHALDTARQMGIAVLMLDADPNAAAFYRAMGAEWLREEETTRPGWNLQVFRYRLTDDL